MHIIPALMDQFFSVNEHSNEAIFVFLADKIFVRQTTDLIMN